MSGRRSPAAAPGLARVGRFGRGYDPDEVDAFLARARSSYERTGGVTTTTQEVREVSFRLRRRGYVVADVDTALERLEDALAERERDLLVAHGGDDALLTHLTALAGTLQRRLARADGHRFRRARGLRPGYDPDEVDAVCQDLRAYFSDGRSMSVDEVRRAVFTGRRGRRGYREADVDAFLDRAAEVMLAVG